MKKAFTLIELIFVVIVISILAAVMIPNIQNNSLKQAAHQVAADIRYTQHLAMIDDRYDSSDKDSLGNVKWFKSRWQILFSANQSSDGKWAYTIFSDSFGDSTGNPNGSEIASVPGNPSRKLTGGQTASNNLNINDASFVGKQSMNLGVSYNVSDVAFSSACSYYRSKRLIFDYKGRPLIGNSSSLAIPYDNAHLLKADCNITLTHENGDKIVLTIKPETGFVEISKYNL
jgi:prepilin-type N-terminal cleavage/methylation domain-containing protein